MAQIFPNILQSEILESVQALPAKQPYTQGAHIAGVAPIPARLFFNLLGALRPTLIMVPNALV